ncbi:MAG: energy-coupling factor ABC transporter permease, partial [Nocardioidaceae bacterium]
AAVLVGPWTGVLCVSVVLIVQALLFADGGVTALGTNITLMSLVAVVVAWLVFLAARRVLPRTTGWVAPAAAVGAFVSVPATAAVFTGLYALGGVAPIPFDGLLAAMLGWHTLIGAGEAAITGLTVASITAVRPDLVFGARKVLEARVLEVRNRVVQES